MALWTDVAKTDYTHFVTIAIVHEIFFPSINGVITSAISLARQLEARGHRVIFIAPAWRAYSGAKLVEIEVEYVPSIPAGVYPGIRLTWPFSHRVVQVLRRHGVDVVHLTAQGTLSWSCLWAARRLGLPVVSTLHTLIFKDEYLEYGLRLLGLNLGSGLGSVEKREWRARRKCVAGREGWVKGRVRAMLRNGAWTLICRFLEASDIVTAPSRYVCRIIERHCPGITPVYLPNCVSLAAAGGDGIGHADGREAAEKTFVYVGRLAAEKSLDVLLEGFYQAWQQDMELRLVVVGDGPQAAVYRRQAARLWAEELDFVENDFENGAVRFTGRLSHAELLKSGLLQGAQALVTASTTENQPMSVLEATLVGLPVIVPDVDGINELVDGNGSLFPAGDAEALAAKMLRMAGNDDFFKMCSARARELGGRYSDHLAAASYEQLILNQMM